MKLVASCSVVRRHGESWPFWPDGWPDGVDRIIIIVLDPDPSGDVVVAHGIDPDRKHGRGRIVFETELRRADLGAFIKTVVDGGKLATARGLGEPAVADRTASAQNVVVMSNPDPDHPTRRLVLALAAALHSDQNLAEAVANRYLRRLGGKDI
jgi:hypothetical protein